MATLTQFSPTQTGLRPGTTVLINLAVVMHTDPARIVESSIIQVGYIGPAFSVPANTIKDVVDINKRMIRIEIRARVIQATGKAGYWVEYDECYRFPVHLQNILEVLR